MSVSTSLNHFALDLFNVIRKEKESNVLISPLSIFTALSMTLAGAKGNTEKEMLEKMQIKEADLKKYHAILGKFLNELKSGNAQSASPINVANKIFVDKKYEVLDSYVSTLSTHYQSEHGAVNFQSDPKGSTETINEWVKKETKDKIPKLLDELDTLTRVVLVNAIHFKGFWEKVFEKDYVEDATFHINKSQTKDIKMMYQKSKVAYTETADATAIALPFKQTGFSMHFILPKERFGLKKLEDKLLKDNSSLNQILGEKFGNTEVEIYIPKFKIKDNLDLKPHLKTLGMKDLFDNDRCDLSGVSGQRDLVVSAVVHEACLEVIEEGAEAAAATATAVIWLGCVLRPKTRIIFRADQPFLVSINYKDSILFFGRIENPM